MSLLSVSRNLPKEYVDTLFQFIEVKDTIRLNTFKSLPFIDDESWMKSGSVHMYEGKRKLSEIPAGNGWKWRQSRGRKTVPLVEDDMKLTILKILPSKKPSKDLVFLPNLKLWVIYVYYVTNWKTVIYCDKGLDPTIEEVDFILSILS